MLPLVYIVRLTEAICNLRFHQRTDISYYCMICTRRGGTVMAFLAIDAAVRASAAAGLVIFGEVAFDRCFGISMPKLSLYLSSFRD